MFLSAPRYPFKLALTEIPIRLWPGQLSLFGSTHDSGSCGLPGGMTCSSVSRWYVYSRVPPRPNYWDLEALLTWKGLKVTGSVSGICLAIGTNFIRDLKWINS